MSLCKSERLLVTLWPPKTKLKRQLVCNSFHGKTLPKHCKKRRASMILSDLWACKKLPSLETRKLFGSEGLSSSSVVKIWVESTFLNPTNTWTRTISAKNEMNKRCALDSWIHNTRGQEMQQPSLQCMTRESWHKQPKNVNKKWT